MSLPSSEAPGADDLADDAVVGEVVDGLLVHLAVLAAHEAGLFAALAGGPLDVRSLARLTDVPERQVAGLAAAAIRFGLVERGARLALSATGRALLLPDSPRYAGGLLDLGVDLCRTRLTYDRLAAALLPGRSAGEPPWTDDLVGSPERAAAFTRAMHAHSVAPASLWPLQAPLGEHRRLLDVAGGSGTHAIAAARAHPQLEAVVFELPPVAVAAREHVAASGLAGRVRVEAGDMWQDPFPPADAHFLADVLHDWPPERCRALLGRCFEALPVGGRILVHEMLLDDDRLGPAAVAASDLAMLLVTGGQQYTRGEVFALLEAAGFVEPEARQVLGDWHLLTARKR